MAGRTLGLATHVSGPALGMAQTAGILSASHAPAIHPTESQVTSKQPHMLLTFAFTLLAVHPLHNEGLDHASHKKSTGNRVSAWAVGRVAPPPNSVSTCGKRQDGALGLPHLHLTSLNPDPREVHPLCIQVLVLTWATWQRWCQEQPHALALKSTATGLQQQ